MVALDKLVDYLDELLNVQSFSDYAPNGLQVEGRSKVRRLVTGVSASQALLRQARRMNADAILVHHGYFWKGENPTITGMKRNRLKLLLASKMSLIAYHLPLDAHPLYGNNAQLGALMKMKYIESFESGMWMMGSLDEAVSGEAFRVEIAQALKREPQHLVGRSKHIQRVAWCTGAGHDYIEAAVAQGADAFVTGEVSERTFHIVKEMGVDCFGAGHHATERAGVRALGDHLSEIFGVWHKFVDIENPV